MELQCEVLVPSHSSGAPDSSVSVADTREERLKGCCMPRFLILWFRGCSHSWEMLSCIPLRSLRLSQVCFLVAPWLIELMAWLLRLVCSISSYFPSLESSSLVCCPGCFFFFPPNCLFSMVSRSLINSETGREWGDGHRRALPLSTDSPHQHAQPSCQ